MFIFGQIVAFLTCGLISLSNLQSNWADFCVLIEFNWLFDKILAGKPSLDKILKPKLLYNYWNNGQSYRFN